MPKRSRLPLPYPPQSTRLDEVFEREALTGEEIKEAFAKAERLFSDRVERRAGDAGTSSRDKDAASGTRDQEQPRAQEQPRGAPQKARAGRG